MKRVIMGLFIVLSVFLMTPFSAEALVSVRGYYRSNGTYVAPHFRTSPDSITSNNFSTNGIHTTGMSRSEAQGWENYLNTGNAGSSSGSTSSWSPASHLSKRETKVVNCQATGKSETYCKSIYMAKKHK